MRGSHIAAVTHCRRPTVRAQARGPPRELWIETAAGDGDESKVSGDKGAAAPGAAQRFQLGLESQASKHALALRLMPGAPVRLLDDAPDVIVVRQFSPLPCSLSVWLVDANDNVADGTEYKDQCYLQVPSRLRDCKLLRGRTGVHDQAKHCFLFRDVYVKVPTPGEYELAAKVGRWSTYVPCLAGRVSWQPTTALTILSSDWVLQDNQVAGGAG